MRSVNEILSNRRHIYTGNVIVADDGIKGFLTVENVDMSFVASWGGGWDHVSVSPLKPKKIPTWDQMCKVKDIFFTEDEAVIEIHPPKAEYVNNRGNCLHLWRANDKEMVLPPSFLVGIRKGQTADELKQEIETYYKENGYNL